MKKFSVVTLLLVSLLSASLTFAANGYYSTQHPLVSSGSKAAVKNPPTDITVFNTTNQTIFVQVPAGGFSDPISPGGYDHIYNYNGAFWTRLVLRGPDFTVINGREYNGELGKVYCPRAVIYVNGYTPRHIVVDESKCPPFQK